MGFPAARVGDLHVCPMVTGVVPHVGGPILPPGQPNVLIGKLPAAVLGTTCICVGPPDVLVKGSATVMIGKKPAVRQLDQTAHGGVVSVGLPTVLIGDGGASGGGGGGGAAGGAAGVAGGGGGSGGSSSSGGGGGGQSAVGPSQPAGAKPPPPAASAQSPEEQKAPEKADLSFELKDFDGTLLPDTAYTIVLEKGGTISGRTDAQGRAYHPDLDPDAGTVELNDIPENDTSGDNAG